MTVDELIKKYIIAIENCSNGRVVEKLIDVIQDLETLKAELKEQHKKDVMDAFDEGRLNPSEYMDWC